MAFDAFLLGIFGWHRAGDLDRALETLSLGRDAAEELADQLLLTLLVERLADQALADGDGNRRHLTAQAGKLGIAGGHSGGAGIGKDLQLPLRASASTCLATSSARP
ncbi:MAG: hypothetical protein HND48_00200 [Chloroflexi bacterium]|nr:hypothetical protein [Chloroflexota bacterium]